jgi:hypothetical protein
LGAGDDVAGPAWDAEGRVELDEGVVGCFAGLAVAGRVRVVVDPGAVVGVVGGVGVVVGPVALAEVGVVGGQVAGDAGQVPRLAVVLAPAAVALV